MERNRAGALASLLVCFGLGGCLPVWSHDASQPIHDHQVTYDDFNDTVDFEPDGDADEAYPPVPVHEFDHDRVADAGGYRVVEGLDWFTADAEERNDLLNEVQDEMPEGSVIVIEVATGELWVVPSDSYEIFFDGMITAWTEDEYDDLPDYVDEAPGFGFYGPNLASYGRLTTIAEDGALRPIVYLHPLVRSAVVRLKEQNVAAFPPVPNWRYLTPTQRLGLMLNLQNYLLMTAYYRTHPFLFGVSIPNGGIYAFPELALWQLAALYAARPWTSQEIVTLSAIGILPALVTNRRNEILRRQLELIP